MASSRAWGCGRAPPAQSRVLTWVPASTPTDQLFFCWAFSAGLSTATPPQPAAVPTQRTARVSAFWFWMNLTESKERSDLATEAVLARAREEATELTLRGARTTAVAAPD